MIEAIAEIKGNSFRVRIRNDGLCHSKCVGRCKKTLGCQMGDPFGIELDGYKGKPIPRKECQEAARRLKDES